MSNEVVVILSPDGLIKGLYNDLIDWKDMGQCTITRASDVEFNNETQMWEVILTDGTYVGAWSSREEAVKEEVNYLQGRL